MPETFTRRGRWFHRLGFAAAAQRADVVITVSEFSAEEIATHTAIPRDRIRVVPNGVDLEPATPKEIQRALHTFGLDDRPYVFWLGTSQPRKNVRVLIDAFVISRAFAYKMRRMIWFLITGALKLISKPIRLPLRRR